MNYPATGLHHVTACAGGAQEDIDFFTQVVGQRLIKQTILFDGRYAHYHLYYANAAAEPGSVMTTFPYKRVQGRKGSGQISATTYTVAKGSLPFWVDHLNRHKVTNTGIQERFGQSFIRFSHPAGLDYEVIEDKEDKRVGWNTAEIQTSESVKGFHGVVLSVRETAETKRFFVDALGFRETSTAWFRTQPRRFTCRNVIFAASALGTMDLLFRLKDIGSLPAISGQLGNRVRTNAESLIGVRVPHSQDDLSKGVAIGSGFYLDDHTHIEAVRYPAGSDAMGLLATLLTGGRPGGTRIFSWLGTLASGLVQHPFRTIRCLHPFGWARESLILLCMQTLDGHIDMRLARPWFWPFRKVLTSRGARIPTFIPQANDFARKAARMIGGTPMSMLTEILFDIPGTAHVLGGCVMATGPDRGVVDSQNRVFGYQNMYICDGSVISANLGVNPSLTICALTERAMSYIPPTSRCFSRN